MSGPDSLWFTTRSALFRPGDEAWSEVARYAEPLRRLLQRRYRWLAEQDREDLVQDVLLALKTQVAARHDRSRGKFRAFVQTVVHRKVTDGLRKRRPASTDPARQDELAAPAADELDALDLEASLLEAVAASRDALTQGPRRDPDALYALADRIVHGKPNRQIAAERGISVHAVARLLHKGRDAIYAELLRSELELADERAVEIATDAFRRWLRRPGDSVAISEAIVDPNVGEALLEFFARFRAARPHLEGDGSVRGRELAQGLGVILETPPQ